MALGLLASAWVAGHAASPAVRRWRPGAGRTVAAGPLQARVFGAGDPVVLLLHGMAAGGNCFGAGFDELGRRGTLVVPDLLGFGASMDTSGPFTAAGHLDALDRLLDALGLLGRPVVVAGHSMGGVLALRWAARHPAAVDAVLTFCAPTCRFPSHGWQCGTPGRPTVDHSTTWSGIPGGKRRSTSSSSPGSPSPSPRPAATPSRCRVALRSSPPASRSCDTRFTAAETTHFRSPTVRGAPR